MSEQSENNNPKESEIKGIRKVGEYLDFVRFIALPMFARRDIFGFEIEGDFASKNDLCQDSLTDWKKREDFWDRVGGERKKWAKGKVSEVLAGLYRTAIQDGKAPEVKLFLQYANEFEEGIKIEIREELSEEDKKLMKQAVDYAQGVKGEDNKESDILTKK